LIEKRLHPFFLYIVFLSLYASESLFLGMTVNKSVKKRRKKPKGELAPIGVKWGLSFISFCYFRKNKEGKMFDELCIKNGFS
jgi:hypothetical protein